MSGIPVTPQAYGERHSAIDGRTTRHQGYGMSQSCRAMTECIFGWGKQHGAPQRHRRTHNGTPTPEKRAITPAPGAPRCSSSQWRMAVENRSRARWPRSRAIRLLPRSQSRLFWSRSSASHTVRSDLGLQTYGGTRESQSSRHR